MFIFLMNQEKALFSTQKIGLNFNFLKITDIRHYLYYKQLINR